jgi:PH (Pleckstrin Homology) domain-containing protein/putative oligomerization/nucleic acid binding protein
MTEPAPTDHVSPAAAEPDDTAQFASLLASGERVLAVRRRHWFTFIQAARWFVLVLGVGFVVALLRAQLGDGGVSGFFNDALGWGFWILFLIGVGGVGWFYLAWRRERYLVTTRRVIEAGGVINKYSRDTSLSMITDMIVGHPWIGRIVGYGEIDLLTASEAGKNKIRFLPDADGFKKTLLGAKHEHEMEVGGGRTAAAAPAAAAPAPQDPPTRTQDRLTAEEVDASVTRLADMRDRGLISAEEFEDKKRDLLDRL